MLPVKPYRQQPGFCGPAALKMVLDFYGIEKTEKELSELTGCKPEIGVGAEPIVAAAKHFGLQATFKDSCEIADIGHYLKRNIPVIVDWFSEDDGHYSVVIDLDDQNIYLQDPELGKVRKMKADDFQRVWFDFTGSFPASADDFIIRRMIVIEP